MSLRVRLIAGLLVLATIGLVTLAAVTYAEQRSFLMDRTDQQARQVEPMISRALDRLGSNVVPTPEPPGLPGFGPPPDGGAPIGSRGGIDLPANTFGQRRDASGRPVGKSIQSTFYGQKAPSPPELPKSIPTGKPITVDSVGGSGLQYRVLATPTGDQPGTTVVAIPLRDVSQTLNRLVRVSALVIAGVLLALGALAWWLVRLGLRPLDRMGDTAGAIAAGDLSRRVSPANERTEVGRLGLALNSMLVQIEAAFAERHASENRLRRFLADASHELRTPLAAIRGYAELFRIGAARRPEETEKAMSRIEDESARMGAIVEDLLTLARLDQLPEVARKPVDLAALARDAADDARAAAPDRQIELAAPDDGATVLGDSSQLRQVVGNLVRNALVHTPAGTPVDLSVSAANGEVTFEVRDHGPGLPTEDTEALFERFWRADPGRGRGPAGAGLGLSIVAAIVAAHGGRASAANAPDGGAVFTIGLPPGRRPAAPAPPAAAPA